MLDELCVKLHTEWLIRCFDSFRCLSYANKLMRNTRRPGRDLFMAVCVLNDMQKMSLNDTNVESMLKVAVQ